MKVAIEYLPVEIVEFTLNKKNKKKYFRLNNLKGVRLGHLQQVLLTKDSHGEARDHPHGGPKKPTGPQGTLE